MQYLNESAYLEVLRKDQNRTYDYRSSLDSGSLEKWQQSLRNVLRELTGLNLIQENTKYLPLEPRSMGIEDLGDYTREKLYIMTEQQVEIPFYLLLPKHRTNKLPLILTPHGHGKHGKETYVGIHIDEEAKKYAQDGDREVALQAVQAGYAVIAPDVRGFLEMGRQQEIEQGMVSSCVNLQSKALLKGRTLIGERVHDMTRLIDYAQTRNEIDTTRIGITGNSGGGTVSLFTAALDERITVAAPSAYFCTFEQSILNLDHCPCNVIPGIMQLCELYDVAGLIAPRPVLMVNGQEDPIFPIAGTQEAFAHLQHIYSGFTATPYCELFIGDGGHRYYKQRVWSFMKEHLS
ncbi:alpha/beta hydrolase family protein [Paenibacillus agricola]|uniref:Acetyl xylan esterase domain-containing protein n=1 Tax=Paenibacillus agricola TaxID=2716264 RepID=A0ABX0JK31_9BACL|nr:alpha/beta hydrolase family protein [Paenibacillus agricola]NHN35203.1 hypothetical protein [Paenibacillus agricola]